MDSLLIVGIVSFLSLNGFNLEEARLDYLRFEKHECDEHSEIEILIKPDAIIVKLKLGSNQQIYNAANFDELKSLLKDKIK